MTSGLLYLLRAVMDLYLLTVALRLIMQWVRADFRNPLVQFILTVTNPLVNPLRRLMPPIGKLDTATALLLVLLAWLFSTILLSIVCSSMPNLVPLLGVAVIRSLRLILGIYMFMVFGYVILSWISMGTQGGGYNPSLAAISNLLGELVNPILLPFRKFIPPIGGLDLSPIVLLLLIGALRETLYSFAALLATRAVPSAVLSEQEAREITRVHR